MTSPDYFATFSRVGTLPQANPAISMKGPKRQKDMSYMFYHGNAVTLEQKIADVEQDVQRFTKACLSPMARPVDYINLIDAQFSLRSLKDCL